MNKKQSIVALSLVMCIFFYYTRTVQAEWVVEEKTNLEGSISGTIQQGHVFKTASGNIYEVTDLTLQLVLELSPDVLVLRNGNIYKLVVKGFEEPLICRKLNNSILLGEGEPVIEICIVGDFEGWDGETIFKLDNGQIWQQASYAYTYHYAYRPKIMIYKTGNSYKMKVDGIDDTIYVSRLK